MTNPRINAGIHYPVDHTVPGMWHMRIVRSTIANGIVSSIDSSFVDEDVIVLASKDFEGFPRYGCQIEDQFVLTGEPKFIGDPVAVVIAATLAAARLAASMIDVESDEKPAVFGEMDALLSDAPLVHAQHFTSESDSAYFDMRPQDGTNVCHRFRIRTPKMQGREEGAIHVGTDDLFDDAFEGADVIVDETFYTPAASHVPMEPHATIAQWVEGRLEVITGTQTPFNMRQDLAGIFGLVDEDVRIVAPPMGGAFGSKTFIRTEALASAASKVIGRPVSCILDRDEVFGELTRHPATVRVQLGAKTNGTFVAKRIWAYVNTGAYADCGPGVVQKMGYAGVGPYRFDNVVVDSYCIYTNLPSGGAYRGYGAMQSIWASERAVDMMAARLEIDAVELRRMNLLKDGDVFCTGEVMHDTHFEELLDDAANAVNWKSGREGKGVAVILKGMQTPSRAEASIHGLPGGRYEVRSGTAEMGQGATEAITRMAAELLGVPMDHVVVPSPDTDRVPYDTRTTSSRSTHMMSRALADAARDLKEHGSIGHGYVFNEGGLDPDTGQGVASSHWHQGSASAHVEVDDETGQIVLKTLFASSYAGKVVNKEAAELQNEGAMIMSLGTSLFEEIVYVDGQMTNPNLSDYNIASSLDCAMISHHVMEIPGAEVHGLGETAVPPVPPSIGNAVASLGYDVRRLPMTPERVLVAKTDGGPK